MSNETPKIDSQSRLAGCSLPVADRFDNLTVTHIQGGEQKAVGLLSEAEVISNKIQPPYNLSIQ